jgi:hypothetical protein
MDSKPNIAVNVNSHTTKRRKPAIYGDHYAMYKGRARREQPQYCANQVIRVAEAADRSVDVYLRIR